MSVGRLMRWSINSAGRATRSSLKSSSASSPQACQTRHGAQFYLDGRAKRCCNACRWCGTKPPDVRVQ